MKWSVETTLLHLSKSKLLEDVFSKCKTFGFLNFGSSCYKLSDEQPHFVLNIWSLITNLLHFFAAHPCTCNKVLRLRDGFKDILADILN